MKRRRILLATVVAAVVLGACGSTYKSPQPGTPSPATTNAPPATNASAGGYGY